MGSDSPGNDRVFVRVDTNPVSLDAVFDEDNNCYNDCQCDNEDSIFADAPDDNVDDGDDYDKGALPENLRKEILELGFPDDGYNYLIHLREIRNAGGGSAFYRNPKFKPDQLPRDVKAYDASRVQILNSKANYNERSIYSVASNTLNARMNRVFDPEVAALLDDSDLSRFGSDVEDLEEDFVVRANTGEEGEGDEIDKKLSFVEESEFINEVVKDADLESCNQEIANETRNNQLELQEYGSDDDDCKGYMAEEEEEILADKLKKCSK
ncbi:hypothetical protein V6N13_128180 [Hibiscus sabdariffa]